jgi:hypothetical protein
MQQVKDGDLRTYAHERAFRRKLKLSDDDPLPPYADRGPAIPPRLDSDGDIDIGRK